MGLASFTSALQNANHATIATSLFDWIPGDGKNVCRRPAGKNARPSRDRSGSGHRVQPGSVDSGDLYEAGGEPLFRDLESEALAAVSQATPSIISLGGGAILRDSNRELIRRTGLCVWLDADAETIAERIRQDASTSDQRPALTTLGELEEIRELLHGGGNFTIRRPMIELTPPGNRSIGLPAKS